MEQQIGRRLRAVRTRVGMSQRQLARVSGVANATISQIEAGRLNPTVSMLKKVLGGIPISLSEFFADDFEASERIFFRQDELTEIAEGGVSYRQVGSNLTNKAIQLLKECYQPGAGTGRHAMTHEGEECGIVLSGRLEVTVAGKSKILGKGDAYYFRSDLPHRFHNPGSEVCELITACSPPTF